MNKNKKNSIAKQFIVYILLFSMLLTIVLTGLQLYVDYQAGLSRIADKSRLMEKSYLRSIAESLWEYDYETLKILVDGIGELSDIQSIEVLASNDTIASVTKSHYQYVLTEQFPITYLSNNELKQLGTLKVVFSLENLYDSLKDTLFFTAVSHLLKTVLVSLFIFYIFYWLVGRHLQKIVDYAKNISSDSLHEKLVLFDQSAKFQPENEVTELVDALNLMRENFVSHKFELEHQANHDPLTNLPNRSLLFDRIKQAFADAMRMNHKVALLFIDIDHFKHINDTYGHKFGDEILLEVSKRFSHAIRSVDTLSRLGGDEFVVLTALNQEGSDASFLATKLLNSLAEAIIIEYESFNISLSIGICIYPDDTRSSGELLRNADTAMYKAKALGRNNFQFYSPLLTQESEKRMVLKNEINEALENDEFVVYFQPQMDINTHCMVGAEALARWVHPEKGFIAPDSFIPFAEKNGLIHLIDQWVLNFTAQFVCKYFKNTPENFKIAVNFSSQTIERNLKKDVISDVLEKNCCSEQHIEIELTESSIFKNRERCIEELERLKKMGFSIAIDDFGTGYSSLSYLKQLPINKLKIDRSFVSDLSDKPDDAVIVNSIITLGQNLSMDVLAEGVETEQQQNILKKAGCSLVQGYLYSKPLPEKEFLEYYNSLNNDNGCIEANK